MTSANISRSIILPVCSLLFALTASAQNDSLTAKRPLVQGVALSADLFGLVGEVFGNDYRSFEVAAEANLHNRFFPTVEIGYGTTDYTDDDKEIHYKVAAPYFRIGADYNFYYKKETTNRLFAGIRLGFSSFEYDTDAPDLNDPVWGGSVPFHYEGVKSDATWVEFVAGLRTRISGNVYMGWSFRYKRRLSVKENLHSEAWYIPGFGINDSALFGFTYNVIYNLPW